MIRITVFGKSHAMLRDVPLQSGDKECAMAPVELCPEVEVAARLITRPQAVWPRITPRGLSWWSLDAYVVALRTAVARAPGLAVAGRSPRRPRTTSPSAAASLDHR